MESPVAHSSNDGIYGLVDHPSDSATESKASPTVPTAAPTPSPTATPTVPTAAPAPTGWFGRLRTRALGPARGQSAATRSAAPGGNGKSGTPGGVRLRRKPVKSHNLRTEVPAWFVSLLVHGVILLTLGLASLAPEVRKAVAELNSAMVDTSLSEQQAEELVHIYADPTDMQRTEAVAEMVAAPGLGAGLTSAGAPTETPRSPCAPTSASGAACRPPRWSRR